MNTIQYNTNVQFQGRSLNARQKQEIQREVALILDKNVKDIVAITKNASSKQMKFLDVLTHCFNRINFYRPETAKDNPNLVPAIFELVKKPKDEHYYIVNKFARSFENLKAILSSTGDDKKKLAFVRKINDAVFNGETPKENKIILDLLNSPFLSKYIKNTDSITPFLTVYKDKPDAVKQLDLKFSSKNYNEDLYRLKANKSRIQKKYCFKETPTLNKNSFFESYNYQTDNFMHALTEKYNISDEILDKGADKPILNMLKTLNKNNIGIRKQLMYSFSHNAYRKNPEETVKHFYIINNIFNKIDNDKHAKNFTKKSFSAFTSRISAEDFDNILSNVSTKKLDIFNKNAWNIIHHTNKEDCIKVLNKHITDLFFQTREYLDINNKRIKLGYKNEFPLYKKCQIGFMNSINHIKYWLSKDSNIISKGTSLPPVINNIDTEIKTDAIKAPKENYIKPTINIQKKASAAKVSKEITIEKVLSFITPRLGVKTFAKQKDLYTKNATKIRLGMLPEIFASVADTRKADRAVGKRRINSSNKDVLDLFVRINGANKKFVNYLLKKRNIDGTRMFEIKDIITTIDKAERKINDNKKANPEYKAKEARKYYNHLYESKIEQYGKVTHQRKLKTNA